MSRITRHGAPARFGAAATTATAAALLVLLAGCSSPAGSDSESGSDADTIDTAAATGDTITGDGYSYSVPEGWGTPDADPASMGADTLAADLTDTDGFADNVNVVLSPAGEVSAEQVEDAGVTELENAGATDVEANDRVVVAGAESAHLSANLSASGTSYAVEQYYVTDEGQTYVVTFSFSPTVDDDQREAVAESVLASWAWA
ncbi:MULTISPECIES: hypothetical protein [unclassified Rathayibacter]|uniref:hypothetical protein n=1 Tax=unclassified Rathayibacter TaxID=2609250 RepID=UPI000F4B8B39|nr:MULTISPECIES: hypothetical protein [unclassified Rathayibacter]MCJ1703910.1 hypothetical protein [Rathayibacter sp. VKM Ac-2926]ROP48070.1 hypothetical protein EDF45_3215 [Rathayibacter sp. PhB186]ROS48744.1 hypothetical protein EDF44_3377 [Rathayibacter sp. PhB185]